MKEKTMRIEFDTDKNEHCVIDGIRTHRFTLCDDGKIRFFYTQKGKRIKSVDLDATAIKTLKVEY